jgi:hypothetical protein
MKGRKLFADMMKIVFHLLTFLYRKTNTCANLSENVIQLTLNSVRNYV